ncbi:MAG: hypothetical protein RR839_00880 [Oscillospiraceae bacterium]
MLRTLKYQGRKIAENLLSTILVIACIMAFALLSSFTISIDVSMARMVWITFVIIFVMPITVFMSFYTLNFSVALGFGATRKNYAWSLQLMKIVYSIIAAFVFVGVNLIKEIVTKENINANNHLLGIFLGVCIATFFLSAIGEMAGELTIIYGKWVAIAIGVIVGLCCGVSGAVVGFMTVSVTSKSAMASIIDVISNFNIGFNSFIIMLAVGIIISFLNVYLSKKTTL